MIRTEFCERLGEEPAAAADVEDAEAAQRQRSVSEDSVGVGGREQRVHNCGHTQLVHELQWVALLPYVFPVFREVRKLPRIHRTFGFLLRRRGFGSLSACGITHRGDFFLCKLVKFSIITKPPEINECNLNKEMSNLVSKLILFCSSKRATHVIDIESTSLFACTYIQINLLRIYSYLKYL